MAESLVAFLSKQLKTGFHLEKIPGSSAGSGVYQLIDPQGEVVYDNNLPVKIHDREKDRRVATAKFRKVGALRPPENARSTTTPVREIEREPDKDKKTLRREALMLAKELMADPQATPRERKLARAFLVLWEDHLAMMELSKQAMMKLRELSKQ